MDTATRQDLKAAGVRFLTEDVRVRTKSALAKIVGSDASADGILTFIAGGDVVSDLDPLFLEAEATGHVIRLCVVDHCES